MTRAGKHPPRGGNAATDKNKQYYETLETKIYWHGL